MLKSYIHGRLSNLVTIRSTLVKFFGRQTIQTLFNLIFHKIASAQHMFIIRGKKHWTKCDNFVCSFILQSGWGIGMKAPN